MKRLSILLVFFLLVTPFVLAQDKIENFNKFRSLDLAFSLTSGIDINQLEAKNNVEFIQADLSFFPKDTNLQSVSNFNAFATPNAKIVSDDTYTSYKWVTAKAGESLSFSVDATVATKNDVSKIRSPIKFPVKVVDSNVLEYTKPSKFIDLNPAIEQQAHDIIGGENDLYKVMFKLADWTKRNIKYDLNTLTAEAVQKSSWVLDNREGVCDEMTNLFISFTRSVGIPARFVSGMVYTNLDYAWGPHGWAEVYFPDHGWVPFDVTFGQYGWVDASHIKLKDSIDSGAPSAEYSWRATGVDIKLKELTPSVSLISEGTALISPLSLSIEPLSQNVGFGSFVPILVTVENKENYYVSASLVIKKAPELTEDNVKEVFLNPGEAKTVGWIVKIDSNLEENYIYTGALEVASSFGDVATSKLMYAKEYPKYKQVAAEKILHNLEKREEKQLLSTIQLSCATDQKLYYSNESALISCAVKNTGSATEVDVCVRAECQQISLNAAESKDMQFTVQLSSSGRIPITAETSGGVASSYVEIDLIALPELYVSDVVPDVVNYKDDVDLSFNVNSDSEITDVHLEFFFGELDLESFKGARLMKIETDGKSLFMQGLKFSAEFTDEKGEVHQQNIAVPIKVEDVPWYAKTAKWIRNIF
jgi:transglutaminase-like putative cysteine protease